MQVSSSPGAPYVRQLIKTIALTGADNLGELDQPTITVFTVTGEITIALLTPYCTEDLASAGGGTLELGFASDTDLLVATTTATAIDSGEFWFSATPAASIAHPSTLMDIVTTENIIGTVKTADITDGTIRFALYWIPQSADAAVT